MTRWVAFRGAGIGLLGLLATSGPSAAQAWLAPAGEAFFSLGYGNVFVTDHYSFLRVAGAPPSDNTEVDLGHIRSQSVGAEMGYAITDRFTVQLGLPFVQAKWYPTCPPPTCGAPHTLLDGTTQDDGNYHGVFQDYRVGALYQVVRNPVGLTPFFAAVIPSHNYQYFAHSAVGRDLREYLLGVNFGSRLDPVVAGGYVQVMYSYAFVEKVFVETVGDIHHDRSNAALELGYFITPSLGARLLASGFYTHGGLSLRSAADFHCASARCTAADPIFLHHDQIDHASGISLGGGLSYALTGSVDVYANYLQTVLGHGGHKIDHGISFGFSWGFSPRQVVRQLFGPRTSGIEQPVQQ
jgi:opacity protein-like surface antigen